MYVYFPETFEFFVFHVSTMQDKLMDVIHHLLPSAENLETTHNGRNQVLWFPEREISVESFVVGALESAFYEMVKFLV